MRRGRDDFEPIVITGIGMLTSVGGDRESVWRAIRRGTSGVRRTHGKFREATGLDIAALVDLEPDPEGRLKSTAMCFRAAAEALGDAGLSPGSVDPDRFGCAVSGHVGDSSGLVPPGETPPEADSHRIPWWDQWFPHTNCSAVADRFGLHGPRMGHIAACASGLIDVMTAAAAIRDDQCDVALAGSGEAIHPLFAAGFRAMRVLAEHDDPTQASRPFDRNRTGFVMGEGAAMFVLERLSHAQRRGARIYAELAGFRLMSEGKSMTSIEADNAALAHLIGVTLASAGLEPRDVGYVNAHGTGTLQNDVAESRAIREAFGSAADRLGISSTKSMLGHLVNAAGCVELAITALALRDGFAPPTLNLTDPDPECSLDCIPLVGRRGRLEHALKLSVAFGGHMAAIALRRWNDPQSGFAYPRRLAA